MAISPIIHVYGPLTFFHVFLVIFPAKSSSIDSEALIKLKESFTNATALNNSWKPGTEPCAGNMTWVGVLCEKNGVVFGLRLGHLGLSGKIDVDALASLSGLRSVALVWNAFSGPIPDFRGMGALKGLYISGNQFSGDIPSDYFSKMEGLKKVWLSSNNFSGPIPSSLARLSQLMELHIENNQFSGTIPPLDQQSLVSIDLSNNNLEGEIPSSLSRFNGKAFEGNPGLCGGNSGRACVPRHSSNNGMKKAVWFVVAFVAVLLVMVVGIYYMKMRRSRGEASDELATAGNLDRRFSSSSINAGKKDLGLNRNGFGSGHRVGSSRRGIGKDLEIVNDEKGEFGLSDLMKASAEVLGSGALGSSYKATMANGLTVVVKRTKEMNKVGRDKFDAEMRRLGSLRHKNVLAPLAYHYRKDEKLLVSEYQHSGSLMFLLHGDGGISQTKLNWPVRLKIIQGIATGLGYLHEQLSSIELPHGDLKSSNVLLTPDYDPLLSDYGLCSLISRSQAAQSLIAYRSPEAILHNQISPKCDVYCLGIIILETITAKSPSQYLNNGQGGTDLAQWVRSAIVEGREVHLIDPDIENSADFLEEMGRFLQIGAACTESDPDQRLDLREAMERIEGVSVNQEVRTFQVLPSLRDGYADAELALDNRNGHSGRRRDSVVGELSAGRRSFAFEIS